MKLRDLTGEGKACRSRTDNEIKKAGPGRSVNSLGRLLTLVLIELIPLMVGIHVHYALLHPVVSPFKIMKKFKTHFA